MNTTRDIDLTCGPDGRSCFPAADAVTDRAGEQLPDGHAGDVSGDCELDDRGRGMQRGCHLRHCRHVGVQGHWTDPRHQDQGGEGRDGARRRETQHAFHKNDIVLITQLSKRAMEKPVMTAAFQAIFHA